VEAPGVSVADFPSQVHHLGNRENFAVAKLGRRPLRLTMAGVLICVMVGTPALALAWDQRIVDGWTHYWECWDYMWRNEPNHIKYCSPSNQAAFAGTTDVGNFHAVAATSSSAPPSSLSSEEPESSSSSEEPSSSSSEEPSSSSSEEPSSSFSSSFPPPS
jgi:hypothetical protein